MIVLLKCFFLSIRYSIVIKRYPMNLFFKISIIFITLSLQSIYAEAGKCTYEYDPSQTKLEWTAFKFTEKTGVKGSFDTIVVTGTKSSDSILHSISGAKFSISPANINSNVPDRDAKIKEFFFNYPKNNKPITGTFIEIQGKDIGKATLVLNLNGITKRIPFDFKIDKDTIIASGEIDIIDFGLNQGLSKLNDVCTDLHKGSDGISKLWPNISLKIESKFKSSCK